MTKLHANDEQLAAALVAFILLEKGYQHIHDDHTFDNYTNELYWFRTAKKELAWLLSQFDNYSPALLDLARETGLQLHMEGLETGLNGGAVSP